jgi:hypothetical protein
MSFGGKNMKREEKKVANFKEKGRMGKERKNTEIQREKMGSKRVE